MAYAFKGLFLTEMNDLEFPCSGSDVIPRGGNYNNSTFQGCLMNGNKPVCFLSFIIKCYPLLIIYYLGKWTRSVWTRLFV